jgi:hypothetical protein
VVLVGSRLNKAQKIGLLSSSTTVPVVESLPMGWRGTASSPIKIRHKMNYVNKNRNKCDCARLQLDGKEDQPDASIVEE